MAPLGQVDHDNIERAHIAQSPLTYPRLLTSPLGKLKDIVQELYQIMVQVPAPCITQIELPQQFFHDKNNGSFILTSAIIIFDYHRSVEISDIFKGINVVLKLQGSSCII